ncbi:hypothetical protein [Clostridium felsineum]|uniref:hypothetical protein n=1 Tax=Clostridium felsineum TaxID=36839 RepID=UPI00098C81EE|nr:hypothetical protein [Clostridium felsineum]URZ15364.1 hypothetical protein CLFE_013820 [Clostridium felsineum DSM 794]
MKTFNSLLRYNFIIYIKSNKFIMPLIVWIAFMGVMYSIKPLDIVSSFIFSMMFLFAVMLWISFSYLEALDSVSEQLVILKVRKEWMYYLGNNVFLMLIGVIMSFIGVLCPIIINVVNNFTLFNRRLTLEDCLSSLILHIIFAVLGCSVGILSGPRCIKSRKLAVEIIVLVAIISVIKFQLIEKVNIIKYITWILPPVCDIQAFFSNKGFFDIQNTVKSIMYGVIYTFIYNVINIELLKRKRF